MRLRPEALELNEEAMPCFDLAVSFPKSRVACFDALGGLRQKLMLEAPASVVTAGKEQGRSRINSD